MGELFAMLAGACFALNTMLTQRGMRKAAASTAVIINLAINNVIYGLFVLAMFRLKGVPTLNLEGVIFAAGGGVAGNVVGRTLNYMAIRKIGSARAVLLSLTQTLFAFMIGAIILKEVLNVFSFIGISLLVFGVYRLSRERVRQDEQTNKENLPNSQSKKNYIGIVFALTAGMAYSGADLLRKLSLKVIPSAVMSSAIGGLTALTVQTLIFSFQGGWKDLGKLDRKSILTLILAGVFGSIAIVLLNSALTYAPVVVVNALYNTRVWFVIALSPLILGLEGKITKTIIQSAVLILSGTLLIIFN